EPAGLFPGLAVREGEEELACVAVGGDRVRAGLLLPGEPVGEESLQDGGEIGHRPVSSSRPAARARSSGTACRYQYVDLGSTCPGQVDRTGSRAWTSPPSRYQSSSVAPANTCLLSALAVFVRVVFDAGLRDRSAGQGHQGDCSCRVSGVAGVTDVTAAWPVPGGG